MVGKDVAAQAGIPALPLILLPTEPQPAKHPVLLELLRETAQMEGEEEVFLLLSDELAA